MDKDEPLFTEENIDAILNSLQKIESLSIRQALQDLFAIGCYFRLIRKHDVGTKLCMTAIDAIQLPKEEVDQIWSKLDNGQEYRLSKVFLPHHEVSELINREIGTE